MDAQRKPPSEAIADKLMAGWTLLAESCEKCGTPLMRHNKGPTTCVYCPKEEMVPKNAMRDVSMEPSKKTVVMDSASMLDQTGNHNGPQAVYLYLITILERKLSNCGAYMASEQLSNEQLQDELRLVNSLLDTLSKLNNMK